jgi:hypothetical protein
MSIARSPEERKTVADLSQRINKLFESRLPCSSEGVQLALIALLANLAATIKAGSNNEEHSEQLLQYCCEQLREEVFKSEH